MSGSELHAKASALFLEACDLEPGARRTFLDQACGDDAELRAAIDEMLAFDSEDALVDDPLVVESLVHGMPGTPERIGPFQILGVLGEGGMGVVYRARQAAPARDVALKVIRAPRATPELVRRFEYEAQALARLQHPCIGQIYESGAIDAGEGRQPYFAMELVEGRPLPEHADAAGLDAEARLELLALVCDGVHHAHQKGVIHRDLKPGNVLVDESGQPKILDFGVARITDGDVRTTTLRTSAGQILGTLAYMSPEQIDGDPDRIDLRTDVYALGVVAYELLAGRLPLDVQGKPLHEAARVLREIDPPPLSTVDQRLRGDVETIVSKALAKDRERRYQSAAQLAADIRRHLRDEPIEARPSSVLYQLRKFTRRNRAVVASAVTIVALLVIGSVVATVLAIGQARAKRDAERAAERADLVRQFFLTVLVAPAPGIEGPDVTVVDALRRAQSEIESALPDLPEVRADVHNEMAVTFSKLGAVDDAEHHAREAVRIRAGVLGAGHRDTLSSQLNLVAVLLQRMGDPPAWGEAQTILDDIESIAAHDPVTHEAARLEVSVQRALLAFRREDDAAAEQFVRHTLELMVAQLGPGHVRTIGQRQNLAILLLRSGRPAEATEALERVVADRVATQGPEHPETLQTKRQLGSFYRDLEAHDRAEDLFAALLPQYEGVFGPDHANTVTLLNEHAFSLKMRGAVAESAVLYADALERARRGTDPEGFQTVILLDSLALTLTHLDQFDEAAAYHRESVDLLERKFPGQRRPIANARCKLADVLLRADRVDEALTIARAGAQEAVVLLSVASPSTINLQAVLARALDRSGAADEADDLIAACVEAYAAMPALDWQAERSIEHLVAHCAQTGRDDAWTRLRALLPVSDQ